MKFYERMLKIKLPKNQSGFLWGPRKVGKSTYLKDNFPDSIVFDFLNTELFLRLSRNPALIRQMLEAENKERLRKPIILDEVQKIPAILDEVHWLIENRRYRFILCGSSARKLRRGHVNLLGGRAWRYQMLPLTSREVGRIDLLKALNQGLIPSHYMQSGENSQRSLNAYVNDYLQQEVFAEGLTRNIPAFSRFFEAFGYAHGELTNYADVARDCGVDAKTVKEYYQILVDTMMAVRIEPFKKRQSRQVISKAPKYYLFDVGVAGHITGRKISYEKGSEFGKAFEHFILMEIVAYREYSGKNFKINFWRTKNGFEVDFVLADGKIAIEVKSASQVDSGELKGMKIYMEALKPAKAIVVCNEQRKRISDEIEITPLNEFLDSLWGGKII